MNSIKIDKIDNLGIFPPLLMCNNLSSVIPASFFLRSEYYFQHNLEIKIEINKILKTIITHAIKIIMMI